MNIGGYVQATGSSVKIRLPRTANHDETELEWRIPKCSNTIERDRARSYFQAYAAAAALHFIEKAMAEVHEGRLTTGHDFQAPEEGIGCGFHEAVQGVLSHHVAIRGGKIANYHRYPPTPWHASPRDSFGTPGPYEDAVMNTPIFEENGPDKFKLIDITRTVRSFEPCLPCGVHMRNLRQPSHRRVLGYAAKEWIENPILCYQRLHSDDKHRWNQEFARTVSFGTEFKGDYRFVAKSGNLVWIRGEITLVHDESGRPVFLQGLGYDITELKQAEGVLRCSKEELDRLVEERTLELRAALKAQADIQAALDAHSIVAITDPIGKITYW